MLTVTLKVARCVELPYSLVSRGFNAAGGKQCTKKSVIFPCALKNESRQSTMASVVDPEASSWIIDYLNLPSYKATNIREYGVATLVGTFESIANCIND